MSHNGGRSTNNTDVLYGTSVPFINVLKHFGDITLASPLNTYPTWDQSAYINEHGYLKATPPAALAHYGNTVIRPNSYDGNWVVKWSGWMDFGISFSYGFSPACSVSSSVCDEGSATVSNGSGTLRLRGTNGRAVFYYTPATYGPGYQPDYSFQVNYYDGDGSGSNLRLLREDHEALLDAGEIFNPDYVAFHEAANYGCWRYLDWGAGNGVGYCNWSDRPSPDDITYAFLQRQLPGWRCGDVAGAGAAKTCTAATNTPVSWTHGELVQTYVGASFSSGTPITFDVGGRGAKSYRSASGGSVGSQLYSLGQGNLTMYYDERWDALIPINGGFNIGGVPFEVKIAHSNKFRSHHWECNCITAADNLIQGQAEYARDNLSPGLIYLNENGNELWNFSAGIFHYLNYWGHDVLGISTSEGQARFYGSCQTFLQMAGILETAFSGQMERCKRVMGVQAGVGDVYTYRPYYFEGKQDTGTGSPSTPVYPNRPIDHCDVISSAIYMTGCNTYQLPDAWPGTLATALKTAADNYDSGNPTLMAAALQWVYDDLVNAGGASGPNAELSTLYHFANVDWPRWNQACLDYEGSRRIEMWNYEGAIAISAPYGLGTSDYTNYGQKVWNLIYGGFKAGAYGKAFLLAAYNAFIANSRAGMPAQYHTFNQSYGPSSYSPWAFWFGGVYDTAQTSGVLDAITEFNAYGDYADATKDCFARYISFVQRGYAP